MAALTRPGGLLISAEEYDRADQPPPLPRRPATAPTATRAVVFWLPGLGTWRRMMRTAGYDRVRRARGSACARLRAGRCATPSTTRADEPVAAPPAVAPEAYDDHYYRHVAAGADAWRASEGAAPDPLYEGALRLAGLRAGEAVVDVGCGRGELLTVALGMGAQRAIGIEYASAAVALARATCAGTAADVRQADARALPVDDASADLVTMLDVVEHLAPDELHAALGEARRILRPGGRCSCTRCRTRRSTASPTACSAGRAGPLARLGGAAPQRARAAHARQRADRAQPARRSAWGRFAAPEVWLGQWVHTTSCPRSARPGSTTGWPRAVSRSRSAPATSGRGRSDERGAGGSGRRARLVPHARACPGRGHTGLVRPPGHARQGRPARLAGRAALSRRRDVRRLLGLRDGAARGGRGRGRRRARPGRVGLAGRRAAGGDRRAARAPRGRHGLPDRARGAGLTGGADRAQHLRARPRGRRAVRPRLRRLAAAAPARPRRRTGARARRVPRAGAGRGRHRPAVVAGRCRGARAPPSTAWGGRGGGGPTGPGSCAWSRRRGSRSRRGRARCSCRPVPGSRRRWAGPRSPTCARAWGASCCSPATWARRTRPSTRAGPGIRKFRRDPAGRIPHRTCGCLY